VPDDLVGPAGASATAAPNVLWRGLKDDNVVLARVVKKNRVEWLQLWQNPRSQVLQLLPRPDSNFEKAKTWLVDAAKRYSSGQSTKAELEAEKQQFIQKETAAMKRPAAAFSGMAKRCKVDDDEEAEEEEEAGEHAAADAEDAEDGEDGDGVEDGGDMEDAEQPAVGKKPAANVGEKKPVTVQKKPVTVQQVKPTTAQQVKPVTVQQAQQVPLDETAIAPLDRAVIATAKPQTHEERTPERAPEPAVAPPCGEIPEGAFGFF
ncbi:unnamed protein product, partial [Prorocentrum cordatum]